MAQLKDLIVTGASRLIGDVYTSQIQISKLDALTDASATTYGPGTSGQVLMSNGTDTYWGTPAATVTESTVSGWGFTKNTGTITGATTNGGLKVTGTTLGHSNTAITAKTTAGIYPVKIDALGHITEVGTAIVSSAAASGGTTLSLVTTGEKYTWNNKSTVSISRSLTSGTKIGTITINGTGTDLYCQTNTDTKVTQAAAITINGNYPVLLGYNTGTTAVTNSVNKTSTLTYNPGSSQLTAPYIVSDQISRSQTQFLTFSDDRTYLRYDTTGDYYSTLELNGSYATLEIAPGQEGNLPGSYVCAYSDKAKIGLQDNSGSSIEIGSTLKINDGTGVGSSGQVLMSNGTKTYWGDITAGAGGNAKIFYGTCSTAAATTAKEVTCADFTSADLVKGAIIYVTFTIKNTGTQSSLTLNVNSTGGKPIKHLRNGSIYNIPGAGYLLADQTYRFTYDGTNWVTDMEYDSGNSLQRTYRSSTNVELPIAAISTAGSATAAYSAISSGSYKDVYAAIPNTDANRVMFNPSTGLVTFGQNGLKTNKIQAPTTAGGSTYGAGTSGQALMTNGTNVYWGSISTTLKFTDKTVAAGTSGWTGNDTTYSGFPYKANITCTGVTADHIPNVIFDYNELISGNFCPFANSSANTVTIYCKIQPTATITIPTIYCV